MHPQHEKAVRSARCRLAGMGLKTSAMPQWGCPFDILINGQFRVEIKAAEKTRSVSNSSAKKWSFNIHRHGAISDCKIDFYILYLPALKELGFACGISIVVPAAEIAGKKTVSISPRSLICIWSKYINRWDLIKEHCK